MWRRGEEVVRKRSYNDLTLSEFYIFFLKNPTGSWEILLPPPLSLSLPPDLCLTTRPSYKNTCHHYLCPLRSDFTLLLPFSRYLRSIFLDLPLPFPHIRTFHSQSFKAPLFLYILLLHKGRHHGSSPFKKQQRQTPSGLRLLFSRRLFFFFSGRETQTLRNYPHNGLLPLSPKFSPLVQIQIILSLPWQTMWSPLSSGAAHPHHDKLEEELILWIHRKTRVKFRLTLPATLSPTHSFTHWIYLFLFRFSFVFFLSLFLFRVFFFLFILFLSTAPVTLGDGTWHDQTRAGEAK